MKTSTSDISNRQLLNSLTDILNNITDVMVTKTDLERFATKDDLTATEQRLTRKLDAHKQVSTRHHLQTRKMLGDLTQQHHTLREGLRQAADSI